MTLIKYPEYNAVSPFGSMFDRVFNDSNNSRTTKFRPSVDLFEDDNAYEIQLSVPGMTKDDIKIDVKEGLLTISGERKFEKKNDDKNYRSIETQYGNFVRSFNLPDHVDVTKISAEYKDGILHVGVPKDEKKALATTVKIK
jgi:HSP20 family protein